MTGHGGSMSQPLKAVHVDALYPHDLEPLTEAFRLFEFDFANVPPPEGRETSLQVSSVCTMKALRGVNMRGAPSVARLVQP